MKRTPEQESAGRARSALDHSFPKCRCGNVARKGEPLCSRCADDDEREAAKKSDAERIEELERRVEQLESIIAIWVSVPTNHPDSSIVREI